MGASKTRAYHFIVLAFFSDSAVTGAGSFEEEVFHVR
jgi:hypothetical protein